MTVNISGLWSVSLGVTSRKLPTAVPLRLAVCLAALGVHVHSGRTITEEIAPGLYSGPEAIDDWSDRLVRYALAMVHAEALRRGLPPLDT